MRQTSDAAPDFDAAELYVRMARAAHDEGDDKKCLAARKMVAVALHLTDGPHPLIHTAHLKEK